MNCKVRDLQGKGRENKLYSDPSTLTIAVRLAVSDPISRSQDLASKSHDCS